MTGLLSPGMRTRAGGILATRDVSPRSTSLPSPPLPTASSSPFDPAAVAATLAIAIDLCTADSKVINEFLFEKKRKKKNGV